MKNALQMWETYSSAVMPADASDIQRLEMRRSFYAGLFSLLGELLDVGNDDVPEDEGVAYLHSLTEEVRGVLLGMVVSGGGVGQA